MPIIPILFPQARPPVAFPACPCWAPLFPEVYRFCDWRRPCDPGWGNACPNCRPPVQAAPPIGFVPPQRPPQRPQQRPPQGPPFRPGGPPNRPR